MKNTELIPYSTDASGIKGKVLSIIFPKSAEEIRRLVASGNVVVRGGGSGLVGGAVPNNEIVVDLSKMNKIISLNREKMTVDVEAGVLLDELNDYLSVYNLEFPVKPSSHGICTIGGMIATNAVGSRAIRYGRTSEWVERLEIVSGKAELLDIRKTDLSDFAGMEGITGIIVKARLRVIEKKKRSASLFQFTSAQAVQEAAMKLKIGKNVSALEVLDRVSSDLLGMEDKYHLIVEYESDEGRLKDREYEKIMELRDKVYPSLANAGYIIIEDPKILISKFAEFSDFLEREKIPFFGHLGVGIIHPVFKPGQSKLIEELIKLTKRMHGQITGEHGIGLSKKEFIEPSDRALIERVKKRYDPQCKINCGKVIDISK